MIADTYSKLMSSIVTSSVWVEPHATFRVWIALLALKDKHGKVRAAVPGLANLCRVTIAECEQALATFLAPDPYSRTPENEGRRIEPITGGWRVLNHDFYRNMESKVARLEGKAEWARNDRAAKREAKSTETAKRPRVDKRRPIQDADTETGKEGKAPPTPKGDDPPAGGSGGGVAVAYTQVFEAFWNAYPTPHKGSKSKAFDVWKRKRLAGAAPDLIEDVTNRGTKHGEWLREGGRFIPHATTYLNGRLWETSIVEAVRGSTASRDRGDVQNRNLSAADEFAGGSDV